MAQPASADRSKIVCKECGYENEAERVYCHNCGVKLDRVLLPAAAEKAKPSDRRRSETIRRVRKVQGGEGKGFFFPLIRAIAFGFLAACIIQAIRVPDDLPPVSDGSVESPFIQFDLDDSLMAPGPRKLIYSEAQVNAYLKATLKAKHGKKAGSGQVRFERSYVKLSKAEGGTVDFGIEHSVFGYPLHVSQQYGTAPVDGKVSAELVGGGMGRLRLHSTLAHGYDWLFGKFWKQLDRELQLFKKMKSITIGDGGVEIISQPAGPGRAP